MTPDQWERVSEIFERAVSLQGPEREAYLSSACAHESEFREEVESLLASHSQAGSQFLSGASEVFGGEPEKKPRSEGLSGRRIGPYLLEEEIGHGGMGEVFAAVRADGQFEKKVALKLVRRGYDTAFVLERFRNERQILAGLDHQNIARLLDGGTTDDGVPYLVMELVEGVPIDSFCDTHKLSITRRLQLFRKVCSAVQYAHQHLVIHRDLKPGNILVTGDQSPKLLDFGIAKILDASGGTETTMLRPMTPGYASPEQIRGETITTATDIYSLGVVLYELLTGRSPYRLAARTPAKLAEAITDEEPERPSISVWRSELASTEEGGCALTPENISSTRADSPDRLQERLRGDVDFILLKALRKEPADRYSSVEQFSEDIRRNLEGLPVIARKGTWNYRAGKFIQRHRAGVAAALLVFVTLVTGVVITVREARIAEANRRRAEARFNDVRELANSLIFDVHDSIADLPGATQARKLILQKALEYLDSLAKESGNEPDLLRELATAYQRIGSLQGNEQLPNLGDAHSALSSMNKMIELRELIARRNPKNRKDQIDLAASYLDYSQFQTSVANNTVSGYDYAKKSMVILDREIVATPDDARVVLQSTRGYYTLGMMEVGEGVMGSVGTVKGGIADLQKALFIAEHAVQLSPDNKPLGIHIALIYELLGDASFKLGDRHQALAYFQIALAKMKALNTNGDNVRVLSDSIDISSKIGDVYFANGELEKCVATYRQAVQDEKKLLNADPDNETLRSSLFAETAQLGYVLALNGHVDEGLSNLRRATAAANAEPSQTALVHTQEGVMHVWTGEALEIKGKGTEAFHEYDTGRGLFETVLASGANDQRMQIYFAFALNHVGASLSRTGNLGQAKREYAKSIGILELLKRSNPEDLEVRYALADAYTGSGMVAERLAKRESTPSGKLAQWRSGRDALQVSLNTWQQIPNPGYISPTGYKTIPPGEVARLLAQSDRQIKALEAQGN
jgi:eukaryotic-like serine/threonine-protein kinase